MNLKLTMILLLHFQAAGLIRPPSSANEDYALRSLLQEENDKVEHNPLFIVEVIATRFST